MIRHYSASQFRSKMRQAQQKQQQVLNKYNQAVRQRNQKIRHAVSQYNQAARAHNTRVRANRQSLKSQFALLNRQATSTRYITYTTSVQSLKQSYLRLEAQAESQHWEPKYNRVLDLSELETANSVEVANRLLGNMPDQETPAYKPQDSVLAGRLSLISADLDKRWRGAVFALNPNNPDAARHFCTSTREILDKMIEINAPEEEVLRLLPDCDKTKTGKPLRRAKISYILHEKGMAQQTLEEFVEQDMENIVQLFGTLNDATHGPAGTFDFRQLEAIRNRAEDSIIFLLEISGIA